MCKRVQRNHKSSTRELPIAFAVLIIHQDLLPAHVLPQQSKGGFGQCISFHDSLLILRAGNLERRSPEPPGRHRRALSSSLGLEILRMKSELYTTRRFNSVEHHPRQSKDSHCVRRDTDAPIVGMKRRRTVQALARRSRCRGRIQNVLFDVENKLRICGTDDASNEEDLA